MPGNQTQRFDAVLEFSEQSVNDVLSTFFDSSGLLSTFLNAVGLGSADGAFSLDVLFDRPGDIPLPAGASNLLDMRFDIGADGGLGQIRAVAGLNMNRTTSGDFDIAEVDFRNQLHFTGFTAGSIPIPLLPTLFADFLRNQVQAIPVVPVPVSVPVPVVSSPVSMGSGGSTPASARGKRCARLGAHRGRADRPNLDFRVEPNGRPWARGASLVRSNGKFFRHAGSFSRRSITKPSLAVFRGCSGII